MSTLSGAEKARKWQLRDRRHQNKAMVKGLGRKSSYLAAFFFFFFFFFFFLFSGSMKKVQSVD